MLKDIGKHTLLLNTLSIILLVIFSFSNALSFLQHNKNKPSFFQALFEPAVMMTCDKGFVSSHGHAGKKLQRFLDTKSNTFNCDDLPKQLTLSHQLRVGAWYYMLASTSVLWRITGISWPAVNYLAAFMFALSILAIYAFYRLGMGRLLALIGAMSFALLTTHQQHLLSLRDYSKAPFILWTIYFLTLLVLRRYRFSKQVLLTIACGLIIGIGYGFRPDVLILLPPLVISLLGFLPWDGLKRYWQRILLVVLLFISFVIAAYPMLTSYQHKDIGTCTWHFAMLGLNTGFTKRLQLTPSVYDWGYQYSDEMNFLASHAQGRHFLNLSPFSPCSQTDDIASGHLFRAIVSHFPADMLARGYQAVILQFSPWYYSVPTLLFLIVLIGFDLRLGIFTILGLLYFFAYPAVQFAPRHYFHLTCWYWFPVGFLLQRLLVIVRRKHFGNILTHLNHNKLKIFATFAITTLILTGILLITRSYQQQRVIRLIEQYLHAPSQRLSYHRVNSLEQALTLYKIKWPKALQLYKKDNQTTQWVSSKMLKVSLAPQYCEQPTTPLTIYYYTNNRYYDFTRHMKIKISANQREMTLFLPIYFVKGDISPMGSEIPYEAMHGFSVPLGIELPQHLSRCIKSVSEVNTQHVYPLWLTLQLPGNWQHLPLYHKLSLSTNMQTH